MKWKNVAILDIHGARRELAIHFATNVMLLNSLCRPFWFQRYGTCESIVLWIFLIKWKETWYPILLLTAPLSPYTWLPNNFIMTLKVTLQIFTSSLPQLCRNWPYLLYNIFQRPWPQLGSKSLNSSVPKDCPDHLSACCSNGQLLLITWSFWNSNHYTCKWIEGYTSVNNSINNMFHSSVATNGIQIPDIGHEVQLTASSKGKRKKRYELRTFSHSIHLQCLEVAFSSNSRNWSLPAIAKQQVIM